MKPSFKHSVKTFKGINRKEGLVYSSYNDGELIIAKTLPKRNPTAHNIMMGNINRNLHLLFESISPGYKQDLSTYSLLLEAKTPHNGKIPLRAWGVFSKMMWSLKKRYPGIDLATITREDILEYEYPIRSVLESMQSGMLLQIEEARILIHEL